MRKSDNVTISSNVLHKKNLFVIRFEVSKFRTGAHITYIVIKKNRSHESGVLVNLQTLLSLSGM